MERPHEAGGGQFNRRRFNGARRLRRGANAVGSQISFGGNAGGLMRWNHCLRLLLPALTLCGFVCGETLTPPTAAQRTPRSSNMELVGYNDLQARSAYQPILQKQGDRWIAYVGHHGGEAVNPQTGKIEPNGTSILDVTDPKHPKYLVHI